MQADGVGFPCLPWISPHLFMFTMGAYNLTLMPGLMGTLRGERANPGATRL